MPRQHTFPHHILRPFPHRIPHPFPHPSPHPSPRRGTAVLAALGVATTILASCSTAPEPSEPTPEAAGASAAPATPLTTAPTSALPPSACRDDQPGRYVEEIFTPAPVSTTEYTAGLKADVYAPADDPAACRVGVVWVHGGGFTQFDRTGQAEQAWGAALAARGYVAIQIDYRLGDGGGFILERANDPSKAAVVDNAIEDARTAIDWVRTSATDLGVDPQRVAIGGTSAGAMTAAGAALTATPDSRPCTLVSISGAIKDDWVGTDPVSGLFIHGDADDVVPYDSSVSAVDEINRAGGTATLVTIKGAGHELTGVPKPEVVTAAAGWLREHAAARCG